MKPTSTLHNLPVDPAADMTFGRVVAQNESALVIDTGNAVLGAQRAASCLLDPEPGDRVLLTRGQGEAFVLAILSRDADKTASLSVQGDLNLSCRGGSLRLEASERLEMTSPSNHITSGELKVNAADIAVQGEALNSRVKRIMHVGERLDSVMDSVSERYRQFMQWVEDTDMRSAGNVIQQVRKLMTVRSENAVITARKDIKVDGERIHMG